MNTTREQRIAELEGLLVETERQLIALHTDADASPSPPPPPPTVPPTGPPARPAALPPPPPPPGMAAPPFFRAETLLRYGGMVLVVASAIFFVSTAISRGWIGPTAQLTLATIASLAMIGQSFRFDADHRGWSLSFAVGGAASLFAAGLVGYVGLDLLSFAVAAGWLVGSIGAFLVLARLHDSPSVALASIPAAIVGVLLLRFDSLYDPALLAAFGATYLVAVAATSHGKHWFAVRGTGAAIAGLMALVGVIEFVDRGPSDGSLVTLAAMVIAAGLLTAASQAIEFVDVEATSPAPVDGVAEARIAALAIPWISLIVGVVVDELGMLRIDTLWFVFGLAAALGASVWILPRIPRTMQVLHTAGALTTMTVALLLVIEGPVVLVVLLGQAVIAGLLAERFKTLDMIVVATALAVAVGVQTLAYLAEGALVTGLTAGESVSVLCVIAVTVALAWKLRSDGRSGDGWVAPWLLALAWASATFRDVDQGQMIVSLLWATVGTTMVIVGRRAQMRSVVNAGLGTLAATAGKLIFVDLVTVDVLWRAGLFFLVGAVFLRLGYVLSQPDPEVDSVGVD